MNAIDAYLENTTPSQREVFSNIRRLVRQLVPDIEETISYGMPTFKYQDQILLHVGAFKDHVSLFPAGDQTIGDIQSVEEFRTSKGTLQFTEQHPIPDDVLKAIIKKRLQNILGH